MLTLSWVGGVGVGWGGGATAMQLCRTTTAVSVKGWRGFSWIFATGVNECLNVVQAQPQLPAMRLSGSVRCCE